MAESRAEGSMSISPGYRDIGGRARIDKVMRVWCRVRYTALRCLSWGNPGKRLGPSL